MSVRLRAILIAIVILLVSLGALAAVIVWRSHAEVTCDLKPLERWPSGMPRTLACDWFVDGVAGARLCAYDMEGKELGCGEQRNGLPWEGTIIEWPIVSRRLIDARTTIHPQAERHFSDGKPTGEWRTFFPDGTVMNRITFADGKRKSMVRYREDGSVLETLSFSPTPPELRKEHEPEPTD